MCLEGEMVYLGSVSGFRFALVFEELSVLP